MKKRENQEGFALLTLLGVLVFVLLVTGIGQRMWRGALGAGSSCREIADSIGVNEINDMCDSIGMYMAELRLQMEYWVSTTRFGDSMDLEGFAGMMAREFAGATMGGFNSPQLSGLMNMGSLTGGSSLGGGGNAVGDLSRLSSALTQGSFGYKSIMNGDITRGLPYLKSSAGMGDVGVLSQLSLGSAYANGTGGLPRNMDLSRYYNGMALGSIKNLQGSNSPEAKQLLSALPASPDAMVRSLTSALK